MASQDTDMVDEVDEAKLAPLGDGEPAKGYPSQSSPDSNVDSREVLETHQDTAVSPDPAISQYPTTSPERALSQDRAMSPDTTMNQDPDANPVMSLNLAVSQDPAMSQDPGPYENPQPQNPNEGPDNVEWNSPLLWLPFIRKLWMIVEDDAFTSVTWNDAGDTVVIKEDLFQSEVLCRRGAEKIFKTNSLKSFICLLNFHGFSKIRPRDPSVYHSVNDRIMIFRNANFQRDKPQLVDNIKRKGHLTITDWPGISSTPKKKKQAAAPTRRSLRIQLRQRSKDGDTRAQKTDPNVQASSGTRSFMLPSYMSFDNMTRRAREEPFPSEPAGPSGEGTSGNVRLAPTATAPRDGAWQEPTGPPDFNSAMSLYNTCYTIPTVAAHSATAPTNAPEGEEEYEQVEEENSSDYKCALCEHLKKKQVPKRSGRW
ncbi:heat shock transcription factor, X-linked member 3-like [Rousettus aegyptiacus]|uniref:heat shock transcription factor, X-linked member 3-like n=1 Tax=Rousettus aegyptiacus TaxID=9407 RepID=UPI00168CB4EC|nr:heat shock transcription factor, X-linked member 3-like [Rousettus aegyptiacus]